MNPKTEPLREGACARLRAELVRSPRSRVVYGLALDAGLACRDIVALDVGDIAEDGRRARPLVTLRTPHGRRAAAAPLEIALPEGVREAAEAYLTWRRSLCPHPDRPMKTVRGRDGLVRCGGCGDVANFERAPLFVGYQRRRLTQNALWAEFARLRARLRLGEKVKFDSLRATFLASQAASRAGGERT